MINGLQDRIAIVTGGGSGIGQAIVERLAEEGCHVLVADQNEASANGVAGAVARMGRRSLAFTVDVADASQVARMAREAEAAFGRVDILVNNAGVNGPFVPLWEYSEADWNRIIAVNLTGTFLCCRHILPRMIARRFGRVVNIASLAGKEGFANEGPYSAAKGGVIALTKSLGKETAPYGVRVNAIAPTIIETPLLRNLPEDEIRAKTAKVPMGRMGRSEEVAALVRFLVSDEASFITGQCSDLSGGRATY